ncbi:MAG: S-layer homology domain-containing protein [Clostridiaceae bacterium]|nr:S-layer homology domain-containing protein [Clostridiaceae bacterium]
MKKLLSLVLVLSLVLGSFGMAFAAPSQNFTDVSDANVAEAVDRLQAFGIVDGYEDGTYRPDQEISREEFAKLVVEALGLGLAAEAAMGATQFPDVPGNWWSAGYVNTAAGQGVIMGDPSGNFRPQDTVSYAEALTMLVRALGYRDEWLSGSWPGNFVAKAAELDITDGVRFAVGGNANRGSVAVMLNNTLDANIVRQTQYGGVGQSEWAETDQTLFEDKLKIDRYEDAVITDIPRVNRGLNSDEITFEWEVERRSWSSETFDIVSGFDFNYLLGLTADIYVNDDDEIFYVELQEREYTVYYDVIEEIDGDEISLVVADDDFDLADDYNIYIENRTQSIRDLEEAVEESNGPGLFAKVVLDRNNKVTLVDAYVWNELDAGVVTDVDTREEVIEFFRGDEGESDLDLAGDPDVYYVFDAEGRAMDLEDIDVDDVIYISEAKNRSTGDDEWYIFVVQNSEFGELERYRNDEIRVNGKNYDLNNLSTISLDSDDDIVMIDSQDGREKLEDATDEDVIVLLDMAGQVRHVRTDVEQTSGSLYGVVTRVSTSAIRDEIRIYNAEGREVVYEVDDNSDTSDAFGSMDASDRDARYLVEYELDSDGIVDTLTLLADLGDASAYDNYDEGTDVIGRSALGNRTVDTDSVVVFNLTEYLNTDSDDYLDVDEIEIITWDDARDEDGFVTYVYNIEEGDRRIKAVFFLSGMDPIGDDVYAGYMIESYRRGGDDYAEIDVYGKGVSDYYIDDAPVGSIGDERVMLFRLNADGEVRRAVIGVDVDDYNGDGFYIETGLKVTGKDGRYIELNDDAEYRVPTNALIYDEDDTKSLYNVRVGDFVDIVRENNEILVISIVEDPDTVTEDDRDLDEEGTVAASVYAVDGNTVTFEILEDYHGYEAGDREDFVITRDSALETEEGLVRRTVTSIRRELEELAEITNDVILDFVNGNEIEYILIDFADRD